MYPTPIPLGILFAFSTNIFHQDSEVTLLHELLHMFGRRTTSSAVSVMWKHHVEIHQVMFKICRYNKPQGV